MQLLSLLKKIKHCTLYFLKNLIILCKNVVKPEETYHDDNIAIGHILTAELNLNSIAAGIVRRVEDIKCAVVVVLDVNVKIIAISRTNVASDVALAGIARVHRDGVRLADLYDGLQARSVYVTLGRVADRIDFDVEGRVLDRHSAVQNRDRVTANVLGHIVNGIRSVRVVFDTCLY